MKDRAAISDFHPAKEIIKKWTGETCLLVFDHEFRYGNNFFMVTDEGKMKDYVGTFDKKEGGVENEQNESNYCMDKSNKSINNRTPTKWVNLGSDREIKNEAVHERRKISVKYSRRRGDFGTPCVFTDRVDDVDKPGVVIHCNSYIDQSFVVVRR